MPSPIENESAIYGGAPPVEPDRGLAHETPPEPSAEPDAREPWRMENGPVDDVLYYAEGQQKYEEAIGQGDHELAEAIFGAYNLAHQKELSGFTLESYALDYDEAHRLNADINHEHIKQRLEQHLEARRGDLSPDADRQAAGLVPLVRDGRDHGRTVAQHEDPVDEQSPAQGDREKAGLSRAAPKRKKKPQSDAEPSPAPTVEKPKRVRTTKAKGAAAKAPVATPEKPATPAAPPADVAALDPYARQRLDRVAENRATDRTEAQKKQDAEATNRARIHLLQDPIGRHIVAIDQGGLTKAYAVDENPGMAAKTVNALRDGLRKVGHLAEDIHFLPDVIKTRFRLKGGEERIAYNVDPEGIDPRHPPMRDVKLGENDRRHLVVTPEGRPDEINQRVLLTTDLPDHVKKRFVYSDTVPGQYFERNRKLAFIDKGNRLATDQNAPDVIASMVSVAQAKGWKAITLKGHEEFQREAWLVASLAGLEVKGFKPSDPDLALLDNERQRRMGNAIQPATPAPAPVANEIAGTSPDAPSPALGAEAVALGEVARLKGVREDQIPNFMKTAQAFIDEAKHAGIDLPALKIFDPASPSAPTVATPDRTKEPGRSIDNPRPDQARKR